MEADEATSSAIDRLVREGARSHVQARKAEQEEPVDDVAGDDDGGTDDMETQSERDDDDDGTDSEPEAAAEPQKKRRRTKADKAAAEGRAPTIAELEAADLVPKDVPEAVENVKTLGDLIARYEIGQNPEFKLHVYRQFPKIFPGGVKADGFYDSWSEPLTNEMIQSEYGGGTYRVAVMGPNPKNSQLEKHFESIVLQYPGEAHFARLPRAMQARQDRTAAEFAGSVPPPMPSAGEHPKLAEAALNTMDSIVKSEREERHRIEERAVKAAAAVQGGVQPIVEAERRRADDLIAAEKRANQIERENFERRMSEERERFRVLEEKVDEMRAAENGKPSAASELREILAMPQFSGGADKASSERMVENILTKHGEELGRISAQNTAAMEAMQRQNQAAMESARASHATELAAVREAGRREVESERESGRRQLESEREAGKRREERAEDQLKIERDERRRDQDRFREQLAERDQQWKDRMDTQKQMLDQSWDARHSTSMTNYENRVIGLQGEIDRLKEDLREAKSRVNEQNDPLQQLAKARELKEAINAMEPGSGGGGGIAPPDPSGDWKSIAMQEIGDKLPNILETVGNIFTRGGGGGGGEQQQQQAQQQQWQPGQIVQTPKGPMVVVLHEGQLKLAPKAALDQHIAERQRAGVPAPRPMGPMAGSGGGRKKKKERGRSIVPNLAGPKYGAEPLMKQKSPYDEPDDDYDDEEREEQRAQPLRRSRKPLVTPSPAQQAAPQAQQPNTQEKQAIGMIAALVHDSVMNAEEPEEFVQKALAKYPAPVLKEVVSRYSPEQVAMGIAQFAPQTAGATPEGQKFIRLAFTVLASALGGQ